MLAILRPGFIPALMADVFPVRPVQAAGDQEDRLRDAYPAADSGALRDQRSNWVAARFVDTSIAGHVGCDPRSVRGRRSIRIVERVAPRRRPCPHTLVVDGVRDYPLRLRAGLFEWNIQDGGASMARCGVHRAVDPDFAVNVTLC